MPHLTIFSIIFMPDKRNPITRPPIPEDATRKIERFFQKNGFLFFFLNNLI
jgi:hypothetical protein